MSHAVVPPPSPLLIAHHVVFTGRSTVALVRRDIADPGPGEVLVRAQLSLISTGTETTVLNRRFAAGTHWDQWVKYPFYPGYAMIGTVEAVGSGVEALRPGQRVACRAPHATRFVIEQHRCFPVPDALALEQAVWFAFAKIAFVATRAAGYILGDKVLLVGAGPIGQMALRWARVAGCFPYVIDGIASRLAAARAGGASGAIQGMLGTDLDSITRALDGARPRVVVDSTGNAQVFAAALATVADRGVVVVLGDTGTPGEQRLTADVISRGLRVVGAHDVHNTAEWDDATITRLFFEFVREGRFPVDGLVTHRFAPAECARAYETAETDRGATLGIAFDWSE